MQELKVVPHEGELLAVLDDPGATPRLRQQALVGAMVGLGVGLVGAFAGGAALHQLTGWPLDVVVGSLLLACVPLVFFPNRSQRSSKVIRLGQGGVRVQTVYGDVRMTQVIDGTVQRSVSRLSGPTPEVHIPWTELSDVRWTDVTLELVGCDDVVHRFDLEEFPRADIERFGRQIQDLWQRYREEAQPVDEAERARRELAGVRARAKATEGS